MTVISGKACINIKSHVEVESTVHITCHFRVGEDLGGNEAEGTGIQKADILGS